MRAAGLIPAAILALGMLPGAALACRCVELDLADYYRAADAVLVGRLLDSTPGDGDDAELTLHFELLAAPFKPVAAAGARPGDRVALRTAGHTATCGVPVAPGASYLLFTNPATDGGPDHVDTCSGTRIQLPTDGTAPADFRDVPARFVMQQLHGLAGLDVLRQVAAQEPVAEDPASTRLIGLLDVAGFAHAGFARLHLKPAADAAVLAEVSSYAELETRELGYESPAAVVYARQADWYRLRLAGGAFGWLPADFAGSYVPYDQLPVRRLAYLRGPWHGFLWPEPGAGLPFRAPDATAAEQPVEVLASQRLAGSLWFEVQLLSGSRCDGPAPRALGTGWVPAYTMRGEPLAWYFSRGC